MSLTPPSSDPARDGLLFLCEDNSARSQMAEGFARFLGPAQMEIFSAGSEPGTLEPLAVRAMKEVGVDISGYSPKGLGQVPMERIATIVSLCAENVRPLLPTGIHHLAWPLPDPGLVIGREADRLSAFRGVRDQIRELVSRLF